MLEGIRVLDLTQYLSGPTCTLLLAGLGADVIKVEPGPRGDASRLLPVVSGDTSSYFVQQNRGKRSVCIDLDRPDGQELVAELAGRCDVLVENFGHGVLERRGLDHATLRARFPRLVYCSISAFGRTGPLRERPGFDLIAQAYAGAIAITGEPGHIPIASGVPMGDCGAGTLAFGAIGHALFHRDRTGEGQFIDISMVEAIFHMHPFAVQGPSVSDGKLRLRPSGRHFGAVPPAGTYQGPQGHLVLQVLDAQWPRLCEAVAATGHHDLAGDTRFATAKDRADHRHALVDLLEGWMQTFTTDADLLAHLDRFRLPAAPVVDPADAHLEPFYRERRAVVEVDDPTMGTVRVPGFPIHSSAVDERPVEPAAPRLGEHNRAVLRDLLGYDDAQVDALHAVGTLRGDG